MGHVASYLSTALHLAEMIKSCIAAAFKMKYVQVSSIADGKKICSALKVQLFYIKNQFTGSKHGLKSEAEKRPC